MQELEYPEQDAARLTAEQRQIAIKVLRMRYEVAVHELNVARETLNSLGDSLRALGAAP